jgi:hypothetical protein
MKKAVQKDGPVIGSTYGKLGSLSSRPYRISDTNATEEACEEEA